jgi:hypothetical protein
LCGDNKHAGYAEGVQGTFQALASIPAGILADRYRRDTVLKYSGVIGIVGTILTIVGLCQPADTTWKVYTYRALDEQISLLRRVTGTMLCSSDCMYLRMLLIHQHCVVYGSSLSEACLLQNYCILTVGLGVFGAYMGAWSPALYAIYADSVASGQRSAYETV